MPKMNIKESIHIDADPATVFSKIADFNHWTAWSPWLIQEPEATVTVTENGKSYAWEGKRVGSGKMQITGEENNRSVDYDLEFLKPFNSKARVYFELDASGDGTKATWLMDSSLPFFLFFMAKLMRVVIAMDYRRGLTMLKDYVETGEVPSKLEIVGTEKINDSIHYAGIKVDYAFTDISSEMKKAFDTLWQSVEQAGLQPTGAPFVIYHKFDPVKDIVSSTCAVPVEKTQGALQPPLIAGDYPAANVFTVRHTGPYRHIGNAWATAQNLIQSKIFKASKALHPCEVYVNDPAETDEKLLITEIRFPLRDQSG